MLSNRFTHCLYLLLHSHVQLSRSGQGNQGLVLLRWPAVHRPRQDEPDQPVPAHLLTLRQAAEYLGVSEKTVRRLVAAGKLHCVHVGRVLRFEPADLFRFVEAWKE